MSNLRNNRAECSYVVSVGKVDIARNALPDDDGAVLDRDLQNISLAIDARITTDITPSEVVEQIVERYAKMVAVELREMAGLFDAEEWMRLLDLIRFPDGGMMAFHLPTALLDDAFGDWESIPDLESQKHLPQVSLADKLAELSLSQRIALVDAMERAWRGMDGQTYDELARKVGLLLKEHVEA